MPPGVEERRPGYGLPGPLPLCLEVVDQAERERRARRPFGQRKFDDAPAQEPSVGEGLVQLGDPESEPVPSPSDGLLPDPQGAGQSRRESSSQVRGQRHH